MRDRLLVADLVRRVKEAACAEGATRVSAIALRSADPEAWSCLDEFTD